MAPLRIPLRIVFYREDNQWVAHCLEFDLVGVGDSREEAINLLGEAIACQLHASIEMNNPENLFCPAEGRYLQMFAAGRDVAKGEVEVHFDAAVEGVEIEEILLREFNQQDASSGRLALCPTAD